MASQRQLQFGPRKQPVQARSEATVAALLEASIQVLLASGYRKMTTTQIARRAGVSVGTLYQYFPNRESVVTAVIERYLEEIGRSIAADCRLLQGRSLREIAFGLADAFISAKCSQIDVARAMHEPLGELGGIRLVRAASAQGAQLVGMLLRSASDASFDDVDAVALFTVACCSSLLQAVIADHANATDPDDLRVHMRAMVLGYLQAMNLRSAEQRPGG